jgi:hypothetical protein
MYGIIKPGCSDGSPNFTCNRENTPSFYTTNKRDKKSTFIYLILLRYCALFIKFPLRREKKTK